MSYFLFHLSVKEMGDFHLKCGANGFTTILFHLQNLKKYGTVTKFKVHHIAISRDKSIAATTETNNEIYPYKP